VVPVVDEVKGRVPEVYIALQPGLQPSQEIQDKVSKAIETMIGKIARPRNIHIVPDMPKTRSGKLMRRVLASISNRMNTGDITTLANPDVVEKVREQVQGKDKTTLHDGPEDLKRFGTEE
jgi:acetyl-CoA synthetase